MTLTMYQILSCGSNGQYQLGNGHDRDENVLGPVIFANGATPTGIPTIVCGGNHTMLLYGNGEVYSSGDNSHGQCGHPITANVPVFTKIEGKWTHVACGWEFSVLVNDKYEVYSCGSGLKGELGTKTTQSTLQKIYTLPDNVYLKSIKASLNHTVMQLSNNQWVGWGNCRKGQLGKVALKSNLKPIPVLWAPTQLDYSFEDFIPESFGVGRDFTVFWSKSSYKVFGKEFDVVTSGDIVELQTMWSSIHLLSGRDRPYLTSFGNNSHGQLLKYSDLEQFVTGSEHGLLLKHNKVYAWGWGEHGNCGIQQQALNPEEVTFDYANLIYNEKAKVVGLGAGCATTWIILEK